jgi:hypothetical protein
MAPEAVCRWAAWTWQANSGRIGVPGQQFRHYVSWFTIVASPLRLNDRAAGKRSMEVKLLLELDQPSGATRLDAVIRENFTALVVVIALFPREQSGAFLCSSMSNE